MFGVTLTHLLPKASSLMKKLIIGLTSTFAAASLIVTSVFANTVVSQGSMGSWSFSVNDINVDLAQFVNGPGIPPKGTGSAQLSNVSGVSYNSQIVSNAFDGQKLSSLTALSYYAYSQSGTFPEMRLVVDVGDGTGRIDILRFQPERQTYFGGSTAVVNTWQKWDGMTGEWLSNIASFPTTDHTLQEYLSIFPNAAVVNKADAFDTASGGVRLAVGGGPVSNGYIDDAVIRFGTLGDEYDFEPGVVNNGFQQTLYSDPNFTNQVGSPSTINGGGVFKMWQGSPAPGVPADNFSARWVGAFSLDTALYRISAQTDNTVKIYIDDALVLDGPKRGTYQVLYSATAGVHNVRIDYQAGTGTSIIGASLFRRDQCYDMNGDSKVNSTDLLIISQRFTNGISPIPIPWDVGGPSGFDNKVDSVDLLVASQKFNVPCPLPGT